MEISKFLTSVNILKDLSDEDIQALSSAAKAVHYGDSEYIIRKGEIGRFLGIMYEGKADVFLKDKKGRKEVIDSFRRGELFGEMSIMTGEPTIADVVSSGPSIILKIPSEIFSHAILKNHVALKKISKIITKRLIHREKNGEEESLLKTAIKENEDPYDLNLSSVEDPIKILTINCGSSSLKYALFDASKKEPIFAGLIEKIGTPSSIHKMKAMDGGKEQIVKVERVTDAFSEMVTAITNPQWGAIDNIKELTAVGHRVVHGGEKYSSSVVINQDVIKTIKEFFPLAPLHNPYNLTGIEEMQNLLPSAKHVAVFDTAFHQGMPEVAYKYALPKNLYERGHIRRYGFHGTNHNFVALKAAMHLQRPFGELKIISCHLGNGASICAINHGRSIDTSMGMTPLEGLIMGTRSGDLDPGIVLYLMKSMGYSLEDVDGLLNKESGLKGISGKSNDMREILDAAEKGDHLSNSAISAFCYRVKKYIGSYLTILGGLDVLIFTGEIGENFHDIRARICSGLEPFGIVALHRANQNANPKRNEAIDISEPVAKVRILVIPADEERMIARDTLHAIGRCRVDEHTRVSRKKPVPISVSAHHVHLNLQHFEILFGKKRTLTEKVSLSQPGQFAAEETVNLIGPRGKIERVRILGPFRGESQVEISKTEEFKLGIDAPVRDSGDLEGTPGLTIEGTDGQITLDRGVICARRHIHMSPEDALSFGLRDRDVVMVKIKGKRELIYGDVLVRVHPDYCLDMHLDTDEANAAELQTGTMGYIESIQSRVYM